MKKFDQPIMSVIEDSMLEPVYASSGTVPTTPIPVPTPDGDWTITTEFCNHNTGSHSELKVMAHNYGKTSGDNLKMVFVSTTYKIAEVTSGDQCLVVSNLSETGFIITRTNRHFNPGENIEFVMQIKVKKTGDKVGAAGETGISIPTGIFCTSYEVS